MASARLDAMRHTQPKSEVPGLSAHVPKPSDQYSVSQPHVHTNDELQIDLAGQILERLKSKSNKPYPSGTVLIINCVPNSLILESEWNDAIERVIKAQAHLSFPEVFLIELVMSHSTTLYGNRKHKRSSPQATRQKG